MKRKLASAMALTLFAILCACGPAMALEALIAVPSDPAAVALSDVFISGVDEPTPGAALDDQADVSTAEGISWTIPVIWADQSLQLVTFAGDGAYMPILAFQIPAGYGIQPNEQGLADIRLAPFLESAFSSGIVTLRDDANGILYISGTGFDPSGISDVEQMPAAAEDAGPVVAPAPMPVGAPQVEPEQVPLPTKAPEYRPEATRAPAKTRKPQPRNTPVPTATPQSVPTGTPAPTQAPSSEPAGTPAPTDAPQSGPVGTVVPTDAPQSGPVGTVVPTDAPQSGPVGTVVPTDAPQSEPEEEPDSKPDEAPAQVPDSRPDETPAQVPDSRPDEVPAQVPDSRPDDTPAQAPRAEPESDASDEAQD